MRHLQLYIFIVLIAGSLAHFASADDFSSTHFTVKDPVVAEPAAYGTSSNYGLWGTIPNIAPVNGTSTSFGVNPSFLAFSNVTMPTLSATADVDSLDLSWSPAVGGATVTYEPGYATTLGGPYTFSTAQTTRTKTLSSLTANTAYYLIIRVKEQSGGALLGYSNELAITTLETPVTTSSSSPSTGYTAPPSTGWILGPNGLVRVTDVGGSASSTLLSGESIAVAPPLFRQFGSLVVIDGQLETPVAGATVELWRLNPTTNLFELWPNAKLGLVIADELGLYSFMVPPGTYQLKVKASGYFDYAGPAVITEGTGVFEQRIALTRRPAMEIPRLPVFLLSVLGVIIGGLMLYFMIRFLIFKNVSRP